MSPWSNRRCAGLPLYEITLTAGAHLANSPDQLVRVDNGTITK